MGLGKRYNSHFPRAHWLSLGMDEIFKDDEGRLCQRDGLTMEVHKQGE